jgi:hypothetical protein
MTDAQLEQWADLLAAEFNRARSLKDFYKFLYGAIDAVLHGVTSDDALVRAAYHAHETIPDNLGNQP